MILARNLGYKWEYNPFLLSDRRKKNTQPLKYIIFYIELDVTYL